MFIISDINLLVVFFFIEYFWIVSIKFVIVVYPVFRYYRMLVSFFINVSFMFWYSCVEFSFRLSDM